MKIKFNELVFSLCKNLWENYTCGLITIAIAPGPT